MTAFSDSRFFALRNHPLRTERPLLPHSPFPVTVMTFDRHFHQWLLNAI
jgi:hypothetical protein